MKTIELIKARRSVYAINKELPISKDDVVKFITDAAEFVPDSFNMRSQRVVVALGENQDKPWDTIYDAFGGKVAREKIDGFKAGAGTVLYFYDNDVVKGLQEQYPMYADNFPLWAQQANAMLQFTVWTGLREMNIGANIQHYNPVIDNALKELFGLPESYILVAQMPFGGIAAAPAEKDKEDISKRVIIAE